MKLGQVVAHHVAHRPDSSCLATQGETALHLNAKLHLAQMLRRMTSVSIVEMCEYHHRSLHTGSELWEKSERDRACQSSRASAWPYRWDEVSVEHQVGALRPDIVLLNEGKEIAAIEVFASHAVDQQKSNILASLGLPWLEVRASDVWYDGKGSLPWSESAPLPVYRQRPIPEWRCDKCLGLLEQRAKKKRIKEANCELIKANCELIRSVRVVDIEPYASKYRRDKEKERLLFIVSRLQENGVPGDLVMRCWSSNRGRFLWVQAGGNYHPNWGGDWRYDWHESSYLVSARMVKFDEASALGLKQAYEAFLLREERIRRGKRSPVTGWCKAEEDPLLKKRCDALVYELTRCDYLRNPYLNAILQYLVPDGVLREAALERSVSSTFGVHFKR